MLTSTKIIKQSLERLVINGYAEKQFYLLYTFLHSTHDKNIQTHNTIVNTIVNMI